METLLIYLLTGAAAGLLAGLFGVGGGLILVPAVALMLTQQGIDEAVRMQVAIGTSLAVISATSISSTLAHHRRDGVIWPVFWRLVPGLIVGAWLGAYAAHWLSGEVLKRVVGVGALAVAAQMALGAKPRAARSLPGGGGLFAAGALIGGLSALIGIGGGSLTVPFLSWCSVEMRRAVGTSAACGVPIAWAGMFGFISAGWGLAGRPDWSLGYVAGIAFVGIAVASVAVAPLGARLAHGLPQQWLKRAFAALLLAVGLTMLVT